MAKALSRYKRQCGDCGSENIIKVRTTCVVTGCGNLVHARMYCKHHYERLWRRELPTDPEFAALEGADGFWEQVDRTRVTRTGH